MSFPTDVPRPSLEPGSLFRIVSYTVPQNIDGFNGNLLYRDIEITYDSADRIPKDPADMFLGATYLVLEGPLTNFPASTQAVPTVSSASFYQIPSAATSWRSAGYVYAPYIPLVTTPTFFSLPFGVYFRLLKDDGTTLRIYRKCTEFLWNMKSKDFVDDIRYFIWEHSAKVYDSVP